MGACVEQSLDLANQMANQMLSRNRP
jgi:hypothetical protein